MFTRTACSGLFHTPARLHPSYFAVASRKRRCQKKRRKMSLWFWHYFQFPRTKGACARTWTCSAVRAAGHASPAAHACEPDVRVLCTPAGLTAATRWACTRLFAATVATELRSLRPRPSPPPSPPSNRRRAAAPTVVSRRGARVPATGRTLCARMRALLSLFRHGSVWARQHRGLAEG